MTNFLHKNTTTNVSLDEQAMNDVHKLIERSPWIIRLPKYCSTSFNLDRQKQFMQLVKFGWPLLTFLLFVEIVIGHILYANDLKGDDLNIWNYQIILCAVVLFIAVILGHLSRMTSSYLIWVGFLIVVVLAGKLYAGLLFKSIQLSQYQLTMTIFIVVIDMLAIRMTVASSTIACLMAGFLSWIGADFYLGSYDIQVILGFFGAVLICTVIALILERQEKLVFLHKLVLIHEMTKREALNKQLTFMSQIDALSGLNNRYYFDQMFESEWNRAQRHETKISILFIDIDHFKAYNDAYGHLAGDECIRQVSKALSSVVLRPADFVARYGGEEFILILPDTDLQGAIHVAEEALRSVDELHIPHHNSAVSDHVTISVGVASVIPNPLILPTTLIESSDIALYKAKRLGRHQVCW